MLMLLPQDMLSEIFSRLSIKTLLRCSCVCRSWRTLLQDPSFAHLQLSNSKQNPHDITLMFWARSPHVRGLLNIDDLAVQESNPASVIIPRPELLPSSSFSISSCNGLLCFAEYGPRNLCVTNPIKGEYLSLPQSPLESDSTFYYRIHYGIGYDAATRGYKVVRIFTKTGSLQDEAEICTLESSFLSWRCIGKIPYSILSWRLRDEAGFFADGALHWWMDEDRHRRAIASMDMGTEKFYYVELPSELEKGAWVELLEWNGCVGVIEYESNHTCFNIWVLKDYPTKEERKMMSWTKQLHVEYDCLNSYYHPQCLQKNDEILVLEWDIRGVRLGSYNSKKRSFTFKENEYELLLDYQYMALSYMPSLVQIRRRNENRRI